MSFADEIIDHTTDAQSALPPNHHGDSGPTGGLLGYLSGLTMVVGRKRHARLVTSISEIDDTDHVVDIGCGPGTAARAAARAGARVTGIDPSAPMIRLSRVFTRLRARASEVRWLCAGAEHLPVPTASSTVCWSLASVHHWRDLDTAIVEVRRVLQPGGRLVALEHRTQAGASGPASHGWTSEQAERFAALLTAAGFVDVRVTEHDLGRRGVVAVTGTTPTRTTPGCGDVPNGS